MASASSAGCVAALRTIFFPVAEAPDSELPPPSPATNVLGTWAIYSDAPNALYKSFADEAFQALRARKTAVDHISTANEWENYRGKMRRTLAALIGPFPGKSPLNARVTGIVQKNGFRIEKIIYESQPGFYVTAALFVPDGLKGKAPAILYCSGHSAAGFRSAPYQSVILNLVRKGFIVLAFDPIGQGERLQYVDAAGRPTYGRPAPEHVQAGLQSFLVGDSLARYMIWDGIRSIDYLLTRPEVDGSRLGITGRSGGGTQSAYIAAVDDRILAAAPENYLTTFEQLLKTRGPQDPEQIFPHSIAEGFDLADLLLVRAPKPALIVATTRDMFNIEGTQTLFAETRRAYAALGQADALRMTVDDAEHASTRKNREATYAFFRNALHLPGDTADENVERLSPDDLRITPTGQVATSLRGESLPDLNRQRAHRLEQALEQHRENLPVHLTAVKTAAARLAGYEPAAGHNQPAVFSGRFIRDGYALEKYLLPVDDRYAIPVLALVPATSSKATIVYLNPAGKSAQAGKDGEMEWLVRQGCTVIAPDLPGVGELGPGIMGAVGPGLPPRLWSGYVFLGKSMLGRQLADLERTAEFARARFGHPPAGLFGLARGALGPLLLHAGALTASFDRIAVVAAPLSYRSMATVPSFSLSFVPGMVPAALTAYDLPDLAAAFAPHRLLLADVRDGADAPIDDDTLKQDLTVIQRAYRMGSSPLQVLRQGDKPSISTALVEWLR